MRVAFPRFAVGLGVLAAFTACMSSDRSTVPTDVQSTPHSTPSVAVEATATVLLQEGFEDGSFAARGWYDNTSMATTTAQHVTGSTRALEVRFAPGGTTPTWGGAARHLFAPTSTLYVSYWVKYSTNWIGSGRSYHPHEFLILSDQDGDWDGPSNNWLTAYIEDIYQNGGIPRLALQDNKAINTNLGALPTNLISRTENRSVGGCNGVVESGIFSECFNMPPWYNSKQLSAPGVAFQPNPGPGYKGDWNRIEVYMQMNSVVGGIGQADGVMQHWFNGALLIDRHDILFRTGARPNIQFRQFMIAPYIGDGSPVDQTMWVDDLLLATSRSTGTPIDSSVASVTVSPANDSVPVGGTRQLTATLKDGSGNTLSGRPVTWTSSSAAATVSASGLVTGAAAGSAAITATSEGKSGTAVVTVTAAAPTEPATVTNLAVTNVAASSITLAFTEVSDGTGLPASYDIRSSVAPISWGSATRVTQGSCAAPLAGTTIGATRTCTVSGLAASTSYQFQLIAFRGTLDSNAVFGALSNVASGTTATPGLAPVATVTVAPASANVVVGTTRQLTVTLKDSAGNTLSGRSVTWTSSTPSRATVSATGLVTGVRVGSATITARSEGKSGRAPVTVANATKPGTVTTLAVTGVTNNVVTLSFTEVNDGTGSPASYEMRSSVGPISWGSAIAVTQGTCTVPVAGTTIGGVRTCTVSGLAPGTSYQFRLVGFRGTLNVNAVFGALSNVASGTTTAGAAAPVASVTLSPTSASVLVLASQQFTPTLKDASGNVLTGRSIAWGSSAPSVASVSGSGVVSGLLPGTATLTATSEGQSGSAALTVTVLPPPPPEPPPPPPSGTWPNEPAGFGVLTDYGFSDPIPLVRDGPVGHGWNILNPDNGQPAVAGHAVTAVDLTAPLGSTVADFIYPVGMGGGWAPATMYYTHASRQEVYAGFWWKPSSPWQNHPSGVNKLAFWFVGNNNVSIQMYGPAPYKLHVVSELPAETKRYAPNMTSTAVTLGVWHRVEWHMTTAGLVEWWLDGVLQARYTGVQYAPGSGFTMFQLSPTWGGVNGSKTEVDHYFYNAVHLSGR